MYDVMFITMATDIFVRCLKSLFEIAFCHSCKKEISVDFQLKNQTETGVLVYFYGVYSLIS